MNTFAEFGLLPDLQKTLKEQKLFKPTEIQTQIIPLMMGGQSVVGIAETGGGKTLAYGLPLLHKLKSIELDGDVVQKYATPRAVVMVPTRELGEQVSKVFKALTHSTRLRVRTALGGMEFEQARRNISGPFEILLATPGRLVQMMDMKLIDLSEVKTLIFDEADQMMDQGFLPDSKSIVEACPAGIPMGLFSATVSPTVQKIINDLFAEAEFIRTDGSGKTVATLITKNITVIDGKRWPYFEKLLQQKTEGGTIVFSNTREQCDKLANEITEKGYECVVYRGEMDKTERRQNLKKFKEGQVELLIATDLAGRGLDIANVGRVINYHLPEEKENYLHRAGRTARAGRKGTVVNLVTERDLSLIAQLEGKKLSDLRAKHPRGPVKATAGNTPATSVVKKGFTLSPKAAAYEVTPRKPGKLSMTERLASNEPASSHRRPDPRREQPAYLKKESYSQEERSPKKTASDSTRSDDRSYSKEGRSAGKSFSKETPRFDSKSHFKAASKHSSAKSRAAEQEDDDVQGFAKPNRSGKSGSGSSGQWTDKKRAWNTDKKSITPVASKAPARSAAAIEAKPMNQQFADAKKKRLAAESASKAPQGRFAVKLQRDSKPAQANYGKPKTAASAGRTYDPSADRPKEKSQRHKAAALEFFKRSRR